MGISEESIEAMARSIIKNLYSEKINPAKFVNSLAQSMATDGGASLNDAVDRLWKKKNSELEQQIIKEFGGNVSQAQVKQLLKSREMTYNESYRFAKCFEGKIPESEIKKWLPEDKIVYNRETFYERLKTVDFGNLSPNVEKRLIDLLEKESIGLTRQEVLLYYNLIKINKLSASVEEEQKKKTSANTVKAKAFANAIIVSLFKKHITSDKLLLLNAQKTIPKDAIKEVLERRIAQGQVNPNALMILAGYKGKDKLISKMRDFMDISRKWGHSPNDMFHYLMMFALFEGADKELLPFLNLSNNTKNFLEGKKSSLNELITSVIKFTFSFFYGIAVQRFEINFKYQRASADMQKKFYKLYSSEDRLKILLNNALKIALTKMSNCSKPEIDQVSLYLKKFLEKNKDLLTKEDLFEDSYEFDDIE